MAEVLDIAKIKSELPYSYPMLLVDRFCRESDTTFVGLKNLTYNEEFFQGHFPGHPIFPGVLQVEAMKQVAVLGVSKKLDPSGENDIYIKHIKKVKFRRPNNPGDRVVVQADIINETDDEISFKATTKNSVGVTCQAEFTLSVRPRFIPDSMPELFNDCDKNENIYMDINQIKSLIPHRYPFLFVDYIVSTEGIHVKAVKNITYNEPFMYNYSQDYSVLPGAIQCEIIAQAGCAYRLSREKEEKLAYYLSIENATFLHPVRPGDQLEIDVEVPESDSKFGRGLGVMKVDGKKVIEMAMKFAIVEP